MTVWRDSNGRPVRSITAGPLIQREPRKEGRDLHAEDFAERMKRWRERMAA